MKWICFWSCAGWQPAIALCSCKQSWSAIWYLLQDGRLPLHYAVDFQAEVQVVKALLEAFPAAVRMACKVRGGQHWLLCRVWVRAFMFACGKVCLCERESVSVYLGVCVVFCLLEDVWAAWIHLCMYVWCVCERESMCVCVCLCVWFFIVWRVAKGLQRGQHAMYRRVSEYLIRRISACMWVVYSVKSNHVFCSNRSWVGRCIYLTSW